MIRLATTAVAALAIAGFTASGIAQAEPRTTLNEGTQTVGTDVTPGLYRTSGPTADDYGYCFITWLPYKGAKDSELIDIQVYEGESFVQLDAGDVITVDGCHWALEN